jgi:hypothetical protein
VRVGYRPDPFLWRDPKRLEDEPQHGPYLAGNRFDAPAGEYRTLYFATMPYGAWLEKLSRFQPIADFDANGPRRDDASQVVERRFREAGRESRAAAPFGAPRGPRHVATRRVRRRSVSGPPRVVAATVPASGNENGPRWVRGPLGRREIGSLPGRD